MKKLSKAQQEVMDKAITKIDDARELGFVEWVRKIDPYASKRYSNDDDLIEYYKSHVLPNGNTDFDKLKKMYDNRRNGIVSVVCNGKTLYRLQELELIEILRDGTGITYIKGMPDEIKVLNY